MGQHCHHFGQRAGTPRSHSRELELFHNSAITSAVSRDTKSFHQVRRESARRATDLTTATARIAPAYGPGTSRPRSAGPSRESNGAPESLNRPPSVPKP
jgi:hypothetical protein